MLSSKEFRKKAWDSLKGKYWTGFLACFIVSLASSLLSIANSVSSIKQSTLETSDIDIKSIIASYMEKPISTAILPVLLVLFLLLICNPLVVGLDAYFIKNTNGSPKFSEIFSRFKDGYSSTVVTMFLMGLKTFLWTLLFIIPGIIKSYEYAMIPYILADNPDTNYNEAFSKSKEMMKGNKWKLFKLQFSFIGWYLLSILTLGIGVFFLVPYCSAAEAEFYVALKEKSQEA